MNPERSNFFIAVDRENEKLVGTAAIRGYDKDYHIENKMITLKKPPVYTESLWMKSIEDVK